MFSDTWTTKKIRNYFNMFTLTMEGLQEAIDELQSAIIETISVLSANFKTSVATLHNPVFYG